MVLIVRNTYLSKAFELIFCHSHISPFINSIIYYQSVVLGIDLEFT